MSCIEQYRIHTSSSSSVWGKRKASFSEVPRISEKNVVLAEQSPRYISSSTAVPVFFFLVLCVYPPCFTQAGTRRRERRRKRKRSVQRSVRARTCVLHRHPSSRDDGVPSPGATHRSRLPVCTCSCRRRKEPLSRNQRSKDRYPSLFTRNGEGAVEKRSVLDRASLRIPRVRAPDVRRPHTHSPRGVRYKSWIMKVAQTQG